MMPISRRDDSLSMPVTVINGEIKSYPCPRSEGKNNKRHVEELLRISPHLSFRWRVFFGYWEVWFNDRMNEPYLLHKVATVANEYMPVDGRTFSDLRRSFEWSRKKWADRWAEMERRQSYAKDRKEASEYDEHVQAGKEIAPLARTLADAGNSSHGSSVTQFHGMDFK